MFGYQMWRVLQRLVSFFPILVIGTMYEKEEQDFTHVYLEITHNLPLVIALFDLPRWNRFSGLSSEHCPAAVSGA